MDDRLLSPLLMWPVIAVGAAALFLALPFILLFSLPYAGYLLLALSFINWIVMFPLAMYHNRSVIRSAAGVERIVTSGPYRFVRHPIYSADIFLAWGIALAFPYLPLVLSAAWLTIVQYAWARMEERALAGRFPGEYGEYKKKTPMLLPDYPAAVRSALKALRR